MKKFTLLELILVVLILGLVSSSALLVVDTQDNQLRYDETKRRLEQIKYAITGPEQHITVSNSVILKGFIADTGQMPTSIDDLLGDSDGLNTSTIQDFNEDDTLGFSWGWRGPYISTINADFKDGWGTDFNFNSSDNNKLTIKSLGADALEDSSDDSYDKDIPLNIYEHLYKTTSLKMDVTISIPTDQQTREELKLKVIILYPDDDINFPDLTTNFEVAPKYQNNQLWILPISTTNLTTSTLQFDTLNMFIGRARLYLAKQTNESPEEYEIVSQESLSHEIIIIPGIQPKVTFELLEDELEDTP